MEWERLLIAVYNGRIISLKVITLSSGPRRLHFGTTGKKWAFHVVDAQWEWMDRLTEPLIGVRRSWLLSGWSEWSGLEEVRVYGLVKNTCAPPSSTWKGYVATWPQRVNGKTRLGYLKPLLLQQSVSPPLYKGFHRSYPHICLIWRSAPLIRMGCVGSIAHTGIYIPAWCPFLAWDDNASPTQCADANCFNRA